MDYSYRRVSASIRNLSDKTLRLITPPAAFEWGQWLNKEFPEAIRVISPGQSAGFAVESASQSTGCEGTIYFQVSDGAIWSVYWNNPFIGYNTYKQVLRGVEHGEPADGDEEDDDLAWVVYTYFDESTARVLSPPAPKPAEVHYGSAIPGEEEVHQSLAGGTCSLPGDGWQWRHSVEMDETGLDRFRGQTCDLVAGVSTIFFPTHDPFTPAKDLPTKVLVYYCAEDCPTELPIHAARFAAQNAGWILVSVNFGENKFNVDPAAMKLVTAEEICNSLADHGYKASIDRLRLACHSRSSSVLVETLAPTTSRLKQNGLVAPGAAAPVVDMAKLERIVSFDSDASSTLYGRIRGVVDMRIVFGFHGTVSAKNSNHKEGWSLPPDRTVRLNDLGERSGAPGVSLKGLVRLRALDEIRYFGGWIPDYAIELLDGWSEPGDVTPEQAVSRSALLPPLGTLNSSNIGEYYARKRSVLDQAGSSPLLEKFLGASRAYVHRDHVAEFFAEAMTEAEPTIR